MTNVDAAAALGAGPGGAAFEEDPPRRNPEAAGAAPLLRLSAFEGRLDWLLELARGRRVDLACLSLVEIADQLILALDTAVAGERDGGEHGAAPLLRRGEWVVMGAALAELRSRLLLPEDTAAGRHAREKAAALREQLIERRRMLDAAAWLDGQAQLGRDVFACGAPTIGAPRQRTTDLTALLRACLAVLHAEVARGERYRPAPLPLWRVPDAIARIRRLLPEMLTRSPLACLLPEVAPEPPDYDLRCRSALASTLVAGLELARQGEITLGQDQTFEMIQVHAVQGAPIAARGNGVAGGEENAGS